MQLETRTSGTKIKHTCRSPATARADQVATATAEGPLGPTFRRPKQCVPRHAVASRVCSRRLGTSARVSRENLPSNFTEPCGPVHLGRISPPISITKADCQHSAIRSMPGAERVTSRRAGAAPIPSLYSPHGFSPLAPRGRGAGGEGAAHVDVRCKLIRAAALLVVGRSFGEPANRRRADCSSLPILRQACSRSRRKPAGSRGAQNRRQLAGCHWERQRRLDLKNTLSVERLAPIGGDGIVATYCAVVSYSPSARNRRRFSSAKRAID
jgi:hypothetical protein